MLHTTTQSARVKIGRRQQKCVQSQFDRRKEGLLRAAARFGDFFQCDVGLVLITPEDRYSMYCNTQLSSFLQKVNRYMRENVSPNLFCGVCPCCSNSCAGLFPSYLMTQCQQKSSKDVKRERKEPATKRAKKGHSSKGKLKIQKYEPATTATVITPEHIITKENILEGSVDYCCSKVVDSNVGMCEEEKVKDGKKRTTKNVNSVEKDSKTNEFMEIEKNAKEAELNELFSGCDASGEAFINKAKELARSKVPIRAKTREKKSKYQKLNDEILKINASGAYSDVAFKIPPKSHNNNNSSSSTHNLQSGPLQIASANGSAINSSSFNNNNNNNNNGSNNSNSSGVRVVLLHPEGRNTINFQSVLESTTKLPPLLSTQQETPTAGLPSILDVGEDANTLRLPPFSEIINNLKD